MHSNVRAELKCGGRKEQVQGDRPITDPQPGFDIGLIFTAFRTRIYQKTIENTMKMLVALEDGT